MYSAATDKDLLYMRRCLDLAKLGAGSVSPNPMVGAVLVHRDRVVAENFHQQFGGPHAEALVIEQVHRDFGAQAQDLLQESVLYVSLEPCAHVGKTPPCADLIVKSKIPRVVIAMEDPSEKVKGKGLQKLTAAGIKVTVGVLEAEATWLNRRFICQIRQQRPYIILKWAETADGFMAPVDRSRKWITGKEAQLLVHRWRSEEDAILVGKGTALADNPQLNVRQWSGKNPMRILIDKHLEVPEHAAIFDTSAPTLVFNAEKFDRRAHVSYLELENFDLYLAQSIVYQLYLMDVQSLLVEGGARTLQLFLDAGLWDEARILQSQDVYWSEGIQSPQIHGVEAAQGKAGRDKWKIIRNWRDI